MLREIFLVLVTSFIATTVCFLAIFDVSLNEYFRIVLGFAGAILMGVVFSLLNGDVINERDPNNYTY